jgi:hypothetical protein
MTSRRQLVFVLAAVFASMGASYRTTNFVVQAPTPQIAQQIGQYAEHYRKEKALVWLGQEMPPWPQPCPLVVTVTMEGPSGATSFSFGAQGVAGQHMEIRGPLDRLLSSVLPHEVTHTVFAYYFQRPVPRWADEGGAVLSEDDIERDRHDKLTRQILNQGREIRLRQLFSLKDYPRQVECLYAEGFSMANYLVDRSDRQVFLKFVAHGMQRGWDNAAQVYYQCGNVEELEEAWLKHLRDTKGQSLIQLAQNKNAQRSTATAGGTLVRLTAPPAQPLAAAPVFRGQAPGSGEEGRRFGNPQGMPVSRPGYLPDYNPGAPAPAGGGWQPSPALQQPSTPVPVHLGPPEFGPLPDAPNAPRQVSPVGFPQ